MSLDRNAALTVGHVLFLGIVGYATLLTEEKAESLETLNLIAQVASLAPKK